MTSTFKLTKAEFKKIFRSPSIFLMAIILVATIFISLYIFQPYERSNESVKYDNASTALGYYDTFMKTQDIDSKYDFDQKYLATDEVIEYYNNYNKYCNLLTDCYNNVITAMDNLVRQTNPVNQDDKRSIAKTSVAQFYEVYSTLDGLESYIDIVSVPTQELAFESTNLNIYPNYYASIGGQAINRLNSLLQDTNLTSQDVINAYTNQDNKYIEGIQKALNNGKNYIYTTLYGMIANINPLYSAYSTVCNQEYSNVNLPKMQTLSKDIKLLLETFYDYLITLKDYSTPIIIIRESDRQLLEPKLESAISTLDTLIGSVNKFNYIDSHKSAKVDLDATGILDTLNKLFTIDNSNNTIVQVKLSDNLVQELINAKGIVADNKDTIIDEIKSYIADETTANISKAITDYKLLEITYNSYINNNVMQFITKDYDKSIYTDFYGYDYKNFNKYRSSEIISQNKFMIESNSYSNDYLTQLSFNQNSGDSTNVFDFMYFTMELCTVIITIFAVMLVCNLITGETESGTIKLLLVRPYRRSKILTAKLLATLFFVVTFVLFSAVLSFVGGYFVYGYTATPILATFSAETTFVMSPLAMIMLDVLFLLIDIVFFVLLALMIAVLFKNYAGSITVCLIVLIANYALNLLFSTTFWYTLLPGMNLHLFKFLGNALINTSGATNTIASIIQSLLITGIESSMSFVFSLLILVAYSIVSIAVAYSVFKNRDY